MTYTLQMADNIGQNGKSSRAEKNIPNLNSITNSPRLAALLQEADSDKFLHRNQSLLVNQAIITEVTAIFAKAHLRQSSKSLTSSPQYLSKLSRIFFNCHHSVWTQDEKKSFSDYFKRLVDFSELNYVDFAKEMCRARDFLFASRLLPVYTEIDEILVLKLCDCTFDTNFVENNRFLLSHLCASIFALKMCTDVDTLKRVQQIGCDSEMYLDDDY